MAVVGSWIIEKISIMPSCHMYHIFYNIPDGEFNVLPSPKFISTYYLYLTVIDCPSTDGGKQPLISSCRDDDEKKKTRRSAAIIIIPPHSIIAGRFTVHIFCPFECFRRRSSLSHTTPGRNHRRKKRRFLSFTSCKCIFIMAERRSRSKSARPGRRSNSKGVIGTSETKMKVSPKKSRREEKEEERSKFAKKKAKGETPVASSDDDEGNEVEGPQMMAGVASADDAKRDKDSTSKDDYDGSDNENDDEEDDDEPEKAIKKNFFSDENAAWLKPKDTKGKQTLLDSDDDDAADDDEMANDQDDSDDEEMEVERQSRLLDARHKEEKEEADEELRATVASHTSIYHLPTKEELEKDVDRVVPPSELKSHVESILEVLADFKQRREPGRSRKEYVDQLGLFIAELYGYLPELIEYFLTMFSPSEALEFVDNSDKQRPLVIRTNTLKTRRKDLAMALMKRGVSLDPLASWSKVGLKIMESPVPIGATPEYLSGHYMLQSAASMCPVLALSPQPNERVLDMSAAPGGKTSYIAQLMRNTGVVFANDLKADRQKATVANLHRLGVKNVITCAHDGRKLAKFFQQYKFDRVLLDAPCSGLGVISRDPSCKVQRTLADVQKTAHLQKELLLAAIDVLNHKSKTGGVMVYSTCSVSVTENEEVVNYALQKRDIKIVDTELDFGTSTASSLR